jgi:hypothetical protein
MQQIDIKKIISTLKGYKHFKSQILDRDTQQESFQVGTISTQFHDKKTIELSHSGQYNDENQSVKVSSQHCWQLTTNGQLSLAQFTFEPKECILFNPTKNGYLGELYLCSADTYLATLTIEKGKTCLKWDIHGPNKNLYIVTTYW